MIRRNLSEKKREELYEVIHGRGGCYGNRDGKPGKD